eukprot:15212356-Heterocapsa_arctica.AAC.1
MTKQHQEAPRGSKAHSGAPRGAAGSLWGSLEDGGLDAGCGALQGIGRAPALWPRGPEGRPFTRLLP